MAHGERVGGGAAERRRGRRLRMFWRHEQLSLQMMRAAMEHDSRRADRRCGRVLPDVRGRLCWGAGR